MFFWYQYFHNIAHKPLKIPKHSFYKLLSNHFLTSSYYETDLNRENSDYQGAMILGQLSINLQICKKKAVGSRFFSEKNLEILKVKNILKI